MISRDILEAHYAEYAAQPDAWVANMERTKRSIVEGVFSRLPRTFFERVLNRRPRELFSRADIEKRPLKVAVLGASDPRYLPIHERIFASATGRAVRVTTLDIDIEHLRGGERVVKCDVTRPFVLRKDGLPEFDIVFSHELLKFLDEREQLECLRRSCEAVTINGFVMHVVHEPAIKGTKELRSWQHRVDIRRLMTWLYDGRGYRLHKLVFKSESDVDWLKEATVLVFYNRS